MRRLLLVGMLFAAALLLRAETPDESVRRLTAELRSARGQLRVDLLNQLASAHAGKAPDSELEAAREALALARSLSYRPGQAAALYAMAEAYEARNDFPHALEYARQALETYQQLDNREEFARCLRKVGDLLFFTSRFEEALKYYFQSLDQYERLQEGDPSGKFTLRTGYVLTTIGNVMRETGKVAESVEYYFRALRIYEQLGNKQGIAGASVNLGGAYQDAGQLEKALPPLLRGRDIARELDNPYLLSICLTNIGSVYLELQNDARAMEFFRESLRICEQSKRQRGILTNLKNIGSVHSRQGRPQKAIENYTRALAIAEAITDRKDQSQVLALLSACYEKIGDHASALRCFKAGNALDREISNEKTARQIEELQLKFDTASKEREIQRLTSAQAMQNLTRRGLLAVAALLLALIGLLYSRYRLKTRTSREIERKNAELNQALTRVEEVSRTDELTRLPNRRSSMEFLTRESDRFTRNERPFVVSLGDIDDFKRFNDLFGHDCGDRVLVSLAGWIRSEIRAQDFVGRWGGEEFILVLPETSLEGGRVLIEKLRGSFAGNELSYRGQPLRVSMTFGLSVFDRPMSVDACLKLADQALYQGKREGKDRVVVQADPLDPDVPEDECG